MNEQSPKPPTDEQIWDELLNSEASQRFLEAEVKKAQELLGEHTG